MRISTVLKWDADEVATYASTLANAASSARSGADLITRSAIPALFRDGQWIGPSAEAAQLSLGDRVSVVHALINALTNASIELHRFSDEVAEMRSQLTTSIAAAAPRLHVDDDGRVSRNEPTRPMTTNELMQEIEDARRLTARITATVDAVQAADLRCARALAEVEATLDAVLARAAPATMREVGRQDMPPWVWARWIQTVPSAGTNPDDVAEWWASIDAATRQHLLQSQPERLGNLYGIPPTIRDQANRVALARGIEKMRREIGEIAAAAYRDPFTTQGRHTLAKLQRQLSFYEVVADQLHAAANRTPPDKSRREPTVQLLLMDPAYDGQGRAALAFGNIATADRVAYVVPGLQQWVDPEFRRTIGNAYNLHTAARSRNTGQTIATVAWIGYNAPGVREVFSDGRARTGAERLADELRGLRAVRRGAEPQLTVVAHSYGSTTAGIAARDFADLGIDDLVVVGSPGVGTSDVDDLHVSRGRVWVGAASGDVTTMLSKYGRDPASHDFGTRFEAETSIRNIYTGHTGLAEHSEYFRPGGESLMNISRIVAGVPHEVDIASDRTVLMRGPIQASYDPEISRRVTKQPTHLIDVRAPDGSLVPRR